mmetsp:Transcript_181071/g.440609  ORF Transcript_181071/g.440609 Transcript_181071/m.440609 type:complete len:455 (-) Transcript_181071:208-1572(-)
MSDIGSPSNVLRLLVGADTVTEGPEVVRRHAEWERQIESLDQKEMEIHQTQLRLIREQTATFRGDLLALRQEVLELKAHNEERTAAHGRLERRCTELAEGLNRHSQLHQDAERKGVSLKQTMDKLSQELETARSRLEQVFSTVADHHSTFSQHPSVADRIAYIEKVIGDSADKHSQALREAQMKLEQLHGRMAAFESNHSDLKRSHSQLAGDRAELDARHASMGERVSYLEKLVGDSADKHGKELDNLKSLHSRHVTDTKSTQSSLQAILQQERDHREQHHASIQARLNTLENALGESADRQARELETLKGSHSRMFGGHATIAERLTFVERQIGESADKQAQELSAAHGKLEQLHGRFQEERKAREQHLSSTRDHMALEQGKREAHQSSMEERLSFVEKALGDSADKHARELDALKGTYARQLEQAKSYQSRHASVEERLDYVEQWFRGFKPP